MSAVLFRRWQPADAGWYAANSQDEEILRWTTEPRGLTEEQALEAIAGLAADALAWAVEDAETGELIGNAAIAVKDGWVEPSYWVVPAARGRGVATRVLRQLVGRAVEAGHQRIELIVHEDNQPSHRVAIKAGFAEVGTEQHETLGPCVRYRLQLP